MTEPNQKPAAIVTPPKAVAPTPSRPEAIAVKVLKFSRPTDVPGKSVADGITAVPLADAGPRARYEIEFQPWLRHHRISYFAQDKSPAQVIMVHESICTWTPA